MGVKGQGSAKDVILKGLVADRQDVDVSLEEFNRSLLRARTGARLSGAGKGDPPPTWSSRVVRLHYSRLVLFVKDYLQLL